ncbi:hypothetical protein YC2023_087179 [Brassica napus]
MGKFSDQELKNSPAPDIAVKYYTGSDLYLFVGVSQSGSLLPPYEFQTSSAPNTRKASYRDDEAEHCKTMRACQTLGSLRYPPHSIIEDEDCSEESGCVVPEEAHCEGIVDCTSRKTLQTKSRSKID